MYKMIVDRCYGCMEHTSVYPCPKCGYTPKYDSFPYALRPGAILNGKYLIGRVLGQGGFGITYIGWDLQLERKVAIKEYFPSGCVSRKTGSNQLLWYSNDAAQNAMYSGQEMFLKEARKMSKARGISQIVQVFDVFQENATAYICMDYIEGWTLKDRLKTSGPLSWEKAKTIFLPIMDTMERVHNAGLIHRDISPDNLMIQPDGGVKILDLGAAKDLNLNSGKSSMQVAKSGFSPLEQYLQQGNSGTWTDVYALAATMYYALTGVVLPSAIDRLDRDPLNWNLPQFQTVPSEVTDALKRALAVRSSDRIQTMAAFSAALQSTQKKKKNRAPMLITGILIVAVFMGLLIGLGTGKTRDSDSSYTASAHRPTAKKTMDQWQGEINELVSSCELETYNYLNGAWMEMYFDADGQECLRIFVNAQGEDEFLFLAKYDDDGNILERYGFENDTLMRATSWDWNGDGNATAIVTMDGYGTVTSRTEVHYDNQGREVSRQTMDGDGNITLRATSTYDLNGTETYSGTGIDGESFVYTYDADGKILETLTMSAQGTQTYHGIYRYDSNGRNTEYLGYDESGALSYRCVNQYTGDLLTGEIDYSYYEGAEYITEYEMLYGPRNIQFGSRNNDEAYGYTSEYVEAMGDTWLIRSYTTYAGPEPDYYISFYNWDGTYTGGETYDCDGNLTNTSETLFDDSGVQIGTRSVSYQEDGGYTVYLIDADYNTTTSQQYNAAGELVEQTEYLIDDFGMETGMRTTVYQNDGSYTVTERDADYRVVSRKTYDTNGKLIASE